MSTPPKKQPAEKLPLSLVIITLNEAQNIRRCIESVPFALEIIVVDSLSQDNTAALAESLGAKVISHPFEGYRAQKQFAVEQATQPWVLSLDADEALSPALQTEIVSAVKAPRGPKAGTSLQVEYDGFCMPRCSFHLGRWIKHGGWYPDYQTRLFRRGKGKWAGGAVHEALKISGHVGILKNDLRHYVFKDLFDQIDTNNEFSSLGAQQLHANRKSFSFLKMVFRPLGKFFECYVWKLGFLDGAAGLIIALGAAQSLFLKYAKLWEIQLDQNS